MIISYILAWIAVLSVILTSFKYITRTCCNKKINNIFRKIHIPLGILLLIAGFFHGLLAGNVIGIPLSDARFGTVLLTFNYGTACLIVSVLLCLSYLFHSILKKAWLKIHRILTVCLLVLIVIHIVDVGIQLPSLLLSGKTKSKVSVQQNNDEDIISKSFSGAQLKDGTYQGEAEGYHDIIKVEVTVKQRKVANIKILEENDTPDYFERARTILDDIMNKQSLDVDTVSGATYSSAAILNAVTNALESAVTEGELEQNNTPPPAPSDHEHGKRKRTRRQYRIHLNNQ